MSYEDIFCVQNLIFLTVCSTNDPDSFAHARELYPKLTNHCISLTDEVVLIPATWKCAMCSSQSRWTWSCACPNCSISTSTLSSTFSLQKRFVLRTSLVEDCVFFIAGPINSLPVACGLLKHYEVFSVSGCCGILHSTWFCLMLFGLKVKNKAKHVLFRYMSNSKPCT